VLIVDIQALFLHTCPHKKQVSISLFKKWEESIMIKMVAMVKKKEEMERGEFIRYWLEVHAPLEAKWPGLKKYVINPAIGAPGGDEPEYDGVAELWFEDEKAMNKALESPERQISREDFLKFVGGATMMVTEEYVILDDGEE
jgi:uncharacterized protein (TIGR02118 family)